MTRRQLLSGALAGLGLGTMARYISSAGETMGSETKGFDERKTEADWQRTLTPDQYQVLRKHGTERAGSSPLNGEHRKGTFACAGCGQPLFSSETKFDSGTGWPSFYQPLDGAVATTEDRSLWVARTEVHCRRCGGHLGHVFEDGPAPTGLRYCLNGVSLSFNAAD
jgi:peptide-methionine (R)-S-oxide reductase